VSEGAPPLNAADAASGTGASEAAIARATIFMSDPSAEAEHVTQLLRGAGYVVVDVPMSMLVARVAVQRPGVIVIDADVSGAAEAVTAVRAMEDGDAIDFLLFGQEATLGGPRDTELSTEIRGFFARPVDPALVLQKIDALKSRRPSQPIARRSSHPPVRPSSRAPRQSSSQPPSGADSAAPASASGPPSASAPSSRSPASPGLRWKPDRHSPLPPAGPAPLSARPPASGGSPRDSTMSARPVISIQASLSAELEALLVDAEQRIGSQMMHEAEPPTPEEELESVLPAELLAALDEPVEQDDDDSAADGGVSRLSPTSARGALGGASAQTNSGHVLTPAAVEATGPYTVAGSAFASRSTAWSGDDEEGKAVDVRAGTVADAPEPAPEPPSIGVAPTLSAAALAAMSGARRESTPPPRDAPSRPDGAGDGPATTLSPGDTPRLLASAVAARASGSLSFETSGALRRVVLRDGDVVTAASSADDETLLAFMTGRGDLRREQVKDLVGKIAPFGRLAGAAIVAHGLLRQDQLWTALRGHAEWILGRTLNVDRGVARIEAEPPGRLKQEPSVFGGSSGAEVLIEVAKRVIDPEEAVRRLGGPGARVTEGPAVGLLLECALDADERTLLEETHGLTLHEVMSRAPGADVAPMLYMLSLLGVSAVAPALSHSAVPGSRREQDANDAREDGVLALDLTAVRERVRARYDLVCEADYFTLLGVPRDATGYEVRRAFLELRRAFEPSRILSPEIADLEADVRTIVLVLDEAYDILRDSARRERYRRALGDAP
jgi:hypothetical protein